MASKKLTDLVPALLEKYHDFADKAREAEIHFTVTCTARSYAEQEALFAQGRKDLQSVNQLRKVVGLFQITEEQNKKCVTWTLNSKHIVNEENPKARAFDVVLLDITGRAHWDIKADVDEDQIPDYEEIGKAGEAVGLKWGGRFSKPDYCHFELTE